MKTFIKLIILVTMSFAAGMILQARRDAPRMKADLSPPMTGYEEQIELAKQDLFTCEQAQRAAIDYSKSLRNAMQAQAIRQKNLEDNWEFR